MYDSIPTNNCMGCEISLSFHNNKLFFFFPKAIMDFCATITVFKSSQIQHRRAEKTIKRQDKTKKKLYVMSR